MFAQLQNWLGSPQSTARITIGADRNQHELEISAHVLGTKLAQRLDSLQLAHVDQLAVTDRVQRFPGLMEFLRSRVPMVLPLRGEELAVPLAQLTQHPTEEVQRITQAAVANVTSATTQTATVELATHLLADNVAQPLAAFASHIDPTGGTPLQPGVSITHPPGAADPSSQQLAVGAVVTIDNRSYQAIKVV